MSLTKRICCLVGPIAATFLYTAGPVLAADVAEIEGNDVKAAATPAPNMVAPDGITGTSTGTSTTTPGVGSADYFLMSTSNAPLAIYRHRMTRTTAGANGIAIMGVGQTGAPSDTTIAQSQSGTPPFVQWYGFGLNEQLYLRVTGAAATTPPYRYELSSVAVTPVDLGFFPVGNFTITNGTRTTTDTEMYLYDGNLTLVEQNDDPPSPSTTLQAEITRSLSPGVYYLAVSNFNSCTDAQNVPPDDRSIAGNRLDFPNALVRAGTGALTDLDFGIDVDGGGFTEVTASVAASFDIYWATFTVGVPPPFGACCFDNGTCLDNQSSTDCANAGGTYRGDGSDCTPNPCPQPGACCQNDGSCTVQSAAQCATAGGVYRGNGTPCDANACVGRCCIEDGSCLSSQSPNDCATAGGTYGGNGTTCTPNPCPQPGACCQNDGGCTVLSAAQCATAGGNYLGNGTACNANTCLGGCCLPDDTCQVISPDACATAGGTFRGIGSNCNLPCDCFSEIEPNESKAAASVTPPLADGDCINGVATGSSTTIPGDASADYFKVNVAPRALGIYRHRLEYQSDTPTHIATIRGLTQTAGVPNAGTDAAAQTASATTTPPRYVQWYGFGKSEMFYFRVTGVATSTAPYLYQLSTQEITATDIGNYQPGQIVLNWEGQGHTTDTDMWVYDANLNAIPDYGNDDNSIAGGGSGAGLQSRLQRNYAAGTYYIAVSNFAFANNLGAPVDDDFRTGTVLDFPDMATNSSTTLNANVTFTISDSAANSLQVVATRPSQFDVLWFKFVVQTPPPFGACCFEDGSCIDNQSTGDCATAGGSYLGDGTDCSPNPCPQPGACCIGGVCSSLTQATCITGGGTFRGVGASCTPNPCVGACCASDASCQTVTPADCAAASGTYLGDGTDCGSANCQGGCCLADDSCVVTSADGCATAGGQFRGPGTDCVASCAETLESEPNETKAQANPAGPVDDTECIVGNTIGSSTTVPGPASADTFLITVSDRPLGIYRHRMEYSSDTPFHIATIRGLNQTDPDGVSGGLIGATDTTIQTASTATTPPRFVQWYGFGHSEQLYVRVTGTTTSTADYRYCLATEAVTAQDIGQYAPGQIVITTIGQGHSSDTDLWVYDGNLNAIPTYGCDDESAAGGGTGATLQSILTRNYAVGTYYLALTSFNLANNLASPEDDDFETGAVLDFPNAAVCTATTTNINLTFTISDSGGASNQIAATRVGQFDILWFKFQVGNPCPGARGDADCSGNIDFFDIDPFLLALFDANAYQTTGCSGGPCCGGSLCTVDVDCSGNIDFFDIDPFLNCLFNNCLPVPPLCP